MKLPLFTSIAPLVILFLVSPFLAGSALAGEPAAAAAPTTAIIDGSGDHRPTFNPDHPSMSSGFMLGATMDYAMPLLAESTPGPAVSVSAGYRWKFLYFGLSYQHVSLGAGSGGHESESWTDSPAHSDYVGFDFVTISSPDATVAFMTHVGVGYRVLDGDRAHPYGPTDHVQMSGLDLTVIGIGAQINAGGLVRLIPEVSLSGGDAGALASVGVTAFFDLAALSKTNSARVEGHTASTTTSDAGSSPPGAPVASAPEMRALTERAYAPIGR